MAREFKDSGIEWIGQIPKEWKVSKLKYLTTILQSGGTPTSSNASLYCEDGTSWVAIGDMRHCGEISYTQKHLTDEGLKEKSLIVFPVGTLLYSIYASVGKVSILGIPAAINQAILAISLNEKAKQEYVKFVLTSMENYVFSLANGNTQFNLNAGIVSNFVLPLPSLLSQQKIADYLDKVCGEVDEMVALQDTMLEELKAYKQSVITEAVTKGLNPNVLMKDSGIDWIGEIPEHWKIVPIKHIKSKEPNAFVDGPFGSNLKSEHFIENGDVLVVESGFITTGKFIFKEFKTISKEHFETIKRSQCKAKDIIIAKIGANYGMAGELPDLDKPSVVSGNSLKITLDNSKMLNTIFVNAMICAKNNCGFIGMVQENAQPALSLSGLNNFKLPVAPIEEQQSIASYLDTKCAEIDALIAIKQAKIEELKEYKKSIIYEYVTGKKEVV